MNSSAHLWALHASESLGVSGLGYIREPVNHGPVETGAVQETIVLIAHDGEKDAHRSVCASLPRRVAAFPTRPRNFRHTQIYRGVSEGSRSPCANVDV